MKQIFVALGCAAVLMACSPKPVAVSDVALVKETNQGSSGFEPILIASTQHCAVYRLGKTGLYLADGFAREREDLGLPISCSLGTW